MWLKLRRRLTFYFYKKYIKNKKPKVLGLAATPDLKASNLAATLDPTIIFII